jgi:osmotically-inducible protein OsmY
MTVSISEAVRRLLDAEPRVDVQRHPIALSFAEVTLTGVVRCDVARQAAERDAWCIFGVDGVKSDIQVRS